MTQYSDWAFEIPDDVEPALRKCGTFEFLKKAPGITTGFHAAMRAYDAGSSRARFSEALSLATKVLARRLLAPLHSLALDDPLWPDHFAFHRDHLLCLRLAGLGDPQIVSGVAISLCRILRDQGAQL